MARKPVLHEQDYVVAGGQVRLSVIVGERQFGTSMVFIDDEAVANGLVEELILGSGDDLTGSTAVIYTMVTDVRNNTDEMSVTWIIAGGSYRVQATATGAAPKKFGSQMFKGVFHFVSA